MKIILRIIQQIKLQSSRDVNYIVYDLYTDWCRGH